MPAVYSLLYTPVCRIVVEYVTWYFLPAWRISATNLTIIQFCFPRRVGFYTFFFYFSVQGRSFTSAIITTVVAALQSCASSSLAPEFVVYIFVVRQVLGCKFSTKGLHLSRVYLSIRSFSLQAY